MPTTFRIFTGCRMRRLIIRRLRDGMRRDTKRRGLPGLPDRTTSNTARHAEPEKRSPCGRGARVSAEPLPFVGIASCVLRTKCASLSRKPGGPSWIGKAENRVVSATKFHRRSISSTPKCTTKFRTNFNSALLLRAEKQHVNPGYQRQSLAPVIRSS